MRKLLLPIISCLFLITACGLIAPVNMEDVFALDNQEVSLTTQKRKVLDSGSLGLQQTDPDAQCQNVTPLPQNCEIVASNFGNKDKVMIAHFKNVDNTVNAVFSSVTSTLGLGQSVTILVPKDTAQEELPATLRMSRAKLQVKLFDTKLNAEEALAATADIALKPIEVGDVDLIFTRESCSPSKKDDTKQECFYKTTNETKLPNMFSLSFTNMTKLFNLLTKGDGQNTVLLEFEAAFDPLKSGSEDRDIFPQGAGMWVKMKEGKTTVKF